MSDRTDELVAVMEALGDWLDSIEGYDGESYTHDDAELIPAVAQILELVQVLLTEYQQTRGVVDNYLMAVASATNMVIANAGEAGKYIERGPS